MTTSNPVLISEICYRDHISWPRFWMGAVVWSVGLSAIIMLTTFWIAASQGWTPQFFIFIVCSSVLSVYLAISLLLAHFYSYRIFLSSDEITIYGWFGPSTFPIEGLQIRYGFLNEDRNFYWAHSTPCAQIYVDGERKPLKYAIDIVPHAHVIKSGSLRRPVALKAIGAAFFCIIVLWAMGFMGYSWIGLTTQDRASFNYVWAMATAAPFFGYYVGRLSWYAWLKDAGLLVSHDVQSTGRPISEFFMNLIGVGIIMGAMHDATFTGPMALLLLFVNMAIYLQCAHIVSSDADRINAQIQQRQQLARETIERLVEHTKKSGQAFDTILA